MNPRLHPLKSGAATLLAACLFGIAPAGATSVRVTITSLAPANGIYVSPFWVAFHDGSFDLFDMGAAASPELERIAEDANTMPIASAFEAADPAGQDATITEPSGFPGLPVFDPGNSATQVFDLDPDTQGFFTFASMVVPSNDAFVGNDDPEAYPVFNDDGSVRSFDIVVNGNQVRDAGTEVNNEMDAAFLNQTAPDTGETEGGVVMPHPGYNGSVGNPDGMPVNILGGTNPAGIFFDPVAADFTREGAQVVKIHIGPAVDGSFSGSWYDPGRAGEGIMVELYPFGGQTLGIANFYTFAPDGSGQAWILGQGTLQGDTLVMDNAYLTTGGSFGDAFDPGAIVRPSWGAMEIQFTSCDSAVFSYASSLPEYGSGTRNYTRLTPVQISGACTP
ncbi:MAG: spondin domain-containing protein [Rhodanobacteraceae bacterium]